MSMDEPRRAVTGNRVRDGVPIFFAGSGVWSPAVDDAVHVAAEAADALLAEAQKGPLPLEAIGPYVIEVAIEDDHLRPVLLRERIRAFGPTA
jgi:uncharacterized protein DUF2849